MKSNNNTFPQGFQALPNLNHLRGGGSPWINVAGGGENDTDPPEPPPAEPKTTPMGDSGGPMT